MKNSAHLKPHLVDNEWVGVPGASIFTHQRVDSFAGMLFSILAVIFILPVFCVKRKMR